MRMLLHKENRQRRGTEPCIAKTVVPEIALLWSTPAASSGTAAASSCFPSDRLDRRRVALQNATIDTALQRSHRHRHDDFELRKRRVCLSTWKEAGFKLLRSTHQRRKIQDQVFRAPQEEGLQQVANLFDELGSEVGETRGNRFHVGVVPRVCEASELAGTTKAEQVGRTH
jgi:hypothetical protein